jgi:hypothetical protein
MFKEWGKGHTIRLLNTVQHLTFGVIGSNAIVRQFVVMVAFGYN